MIDWATLAAEELAASRTLPQENVRDSGLIVPLYTSSGHLRTWLKIAQEPAMVLYETPAVAMSRWLAFANNPEQQFCIFHDHSYGQAMFYFRSAIPNLCYFGVTYPTTEQGRTTPGSIWAGDCRCWRFGGPCPKPTN